MTGRCCPRLPRAGELRDRLIHNRWFAETLRAVQASGLPHAWVGAGVIRDIVWSQNHSQPSPAIRDVDVAFFDLRDLSPARDHSATAQLVRLLDRPWEATNQAAVHVWYASYFGGPPVPPFSSVHDAVAAHGLDDLLDGVWRRNPTRVSADISAARLARQHIARRYPAVRIVAPSAAPN